MVNFLPKEYYDRFLSDVSKTRIPSPSECVFFDLTWAVCLVVRRISTVPGGYSCGSHTVGEHPRHHLYAWREAEFFDLPVHLDPADGSFSDGLHEGTNIDYRFETVGDCSPVWPSRRNTQPFGVDLGSAGIRTREKTWRRMETNRRGWVSGPHIQGTREVMLDFHLANIIGRPSTRS